MEQEERKEEQEKKSSYKNVKEVFKEYNSTSFALNAARIQNVTLYKKSSKMVLDLLTDQFVKVADLVGFEKYLEDRFQVKEVQIIFTYENGIEDQFDLTAEWQDFITYMARKHPLTRTILKDSQIMIKKQNKIEVALGFRGKDVLLAKKVDKTIEEILKDLYGFHASVAFLENASEDKLKEYQEYSKNLERQAIKMAEEEAARQVEESKTAQEVPPAEASAPSGPVPPEPPAVEENEVTPLIYGRNMNIKEPLVKVIDLSVDSGKICLDGEIINMDSRELKSGKLLITFDLYDGSSTITCKVFAEAEKAGAMKGRLKGAKGVKVAGTAQYDPFAKELGVIANVIIESTGIKRAERKDNSEVKRVELHMHTQMSQMDGISATKDLIKRAMKWGMKSIAITDHGVVQAFPDAHKLLGRDNPDMKVLYGVEAYLVPDRTPSVSFSKGQDLDTTYCVLDLETTGLSFRTEKITEIGVMKVKGGEVLEEFSCFVNPEKPIPQKVVEVTNITDDMVKDAETIDVVMPKLLDFLGDSVLVAHNADFDIGFLKYNAKELGYELNNTYLDTLRLAKDLFPDYKKYKLGIIAENLGIKVDRKSTRLNSSH